MVTLLSKATGNLTDSGKQTKQPGGSITLECSFTDLNGPITEMDIRGPVDGESILKVNFELKTGDTRYGTIKSGVIPFNKDQIQYLRDKKLFVEIHTRLFPNGELRGLIQDTNLVSDLNGDGRTDFLLYQPNRDTFYGALNDGKFEPFRNQLGPVSNSDIDNSAATPASMGDFDGDGRSDYVVIRTIDNQINWVIYQSSDNTVRKVPWGRYSLGDILVPADYDGDGKQDIAIFRRTTGVWYIIESSTDQPRYEYWGKAFDLPSVGDYDGDGKADLTVVRDVKGHLVWYTRRSSDSVSEEMLWGLSGTDGFFFATPVDTDGDGAQDRLVFRREGERNVFWILTKAGYGQVQWGLSTDVQFVGDFDGDGKTDLGARRVVDDHVEWWILQKVGEKVSDQTVKVFNYPPKN